MHPNIDGGVWGPGWARSFGVLLRKTPHACPALKQRICGVKRSHPQAESVPEDAHNAQQRGKPQGYSVKIADGFLEVGNAVETSGMSSCLKLPWARFERLNPKTDAL
jgi:hypothetical protein